MSINVECPRCDWSARAPDKFAGRRIRCRECGAPFQVCSDDGPFEDYEDYEDSDDDYEDYDSPRHRQRRSAPRRNRARGRSETRMYVVGGVVLGMIVAGGLLAASLSGDSQDNSAAELVKVADGDNPPTSPTDDSEAASSTDPVSTDDAANRLAPRTQQVKAPAKPPLYAQMPQVEPDEKALTRQGQDAPDLPLTTVDGKPVRLKELRGKTVVVNFFATWCPHCQHELPHLERMWRVYGKDEDFVMCVIGREESLATLAALKQEKGFTFPVVSDPQRAMYTRYATWGIPRTYLIGPDGKIAYQTLGHGEFQIAQIERGIQLSLKDDNNPQQ